MLTGDNDEIAQKVATEVGLTGYKASLLPQNKVEEVEELLNSKKDKEVLCFVGDGINDAPVLMRSDIGIAMGAVGSDAAIEASDIVLMKDDLSEVATAIQLSKKVIANIKMNLFWAFFYNILFIPIAAGVLYAPFHITLSPMICALAMSLSSICVVLNALRINNFKKEKK